MLVFIVCLVSLAEMEMMGVVVSLSNFSQPDEGNSWKSFNVLILFLGEVAQDKFRKRTIAVPWMFLLQETVHWVNPEPGITVIVLLVLMDF